MADRHRPRSGDRHRPGYVRPKPPVRRTPHPGGPRAKGAHSRGSAPPTPRKYHPRSRPRSRRFVAWDGEGAEFPDGSHRYTLIANSEGDSLFDSEGLGTEEVVRFIVQRAEAMKGDPLHVSFGFSYDVNMILRQAPREFLERVWQAAEWSGTAEDPHRSSRLLWWRGVGVRWLPRHMVRFGWRDRWGAGADFMDRESCLIYDTLGFFQSSFVHTLERWLGEDWPELPLIREGKALRSTFEPESREVQLPYCLAECRALVEVMNRLRAKLGEIDLQPRSWHGPGAIAQMLLEREGIEAHMGPPATPAQMNVFQRAYIGGRIELIQYGVLR